MTQARAVCASACLSAWVCVIVALLLASPGIAHAAVAPSADVPRPLSCGADQAGFPAAARVRHRCLPISLVGARFQPVAIGLDRSGPNFQGAASIGFVAALNRWLTVDPTRFGPEFAPRSRWRLESITLRLGPWVFAKRFEPLEAVVIDFHDDESFHVRVRFDRPTRAPDPIIEGVRAFGGQAIPPRVAVAESPPPMRWHFATLRERDRFLAALSRHGVRVSEVPPTEEGIEGPRTPASVDGAPGVECRYSRIWLEGCWPVGAERRGRC